jgi:hypothetical protein
MPIKPAAPAKPRLRAADGSFSARGTLSSKVLRKAWSAPRPTPPVVAALNAHLSPVEFYSNFVADKVDTTNAVIRGVSVMTSGLTARGHDLEVDSTTLEQVKTCAESKAQVPVKVDHKSGAAAVCGFLTNFHLDGAKLKADWHLLKTHPQKDQILEVAERMPGGVGLSASFLPPEKAEKTASGKKAARCAELLSVDYVTLPAANPDGMFGAKVDSPQNAIPTMTTEEITKLVQDAVAEATAPLTEQIESLQSELAAAQQGEPDLETLAQMSDEELAELGLDPADVNAAIAEHNAALEGDDNGEGENGEGELVTADAQGGEGSGDATGLQANVVAQLTQFAAELRQAKAEREVAAQEQLFEDIEVRFDALLEQNIQLREQLTTGGKPASHGATQFTTKTGVKVEFGTKEHGQFEEAVIAHLEANPKDRTSVAFSAVIKADPEAYKDYLVRKGCRKG